MKDLLDHQGDCTESELHLLKYGRHFRLTPEKKLIVGRRKPDNEKILKYLDPSTDTTIDVIDHPSPIGLVPGGAPDDILFLAGGICAGYSKAPNFQPVKVSVGHAGRKKTIEVIAIPPDDVKKKMI